MNKNILIILLFGVLNAHNITIENYDKFNSELDKKMEIINKSAKRDVYSILDSYNNKETRLIKKWFKVATQITHNNNLKFFIDNTYIKVKSMTSKLFLVENNNITKIDKRVLMQKYNYIKKVADKYSSVKPLNKKIYISVSNGMGKLNLRTMPIVSSLTLKKFSNAKPITFMDNTELKLLYAIKYMQNNKIAFWGYIESPTDGLKGWINLKYTKVE